ncbi:hypothetical protein [Roseibium sp. MMSF_3412]|uniref:hypothetical protein n=1 Tax=Roseibium sp. MMSF_3412 TaxID=3046712 RepID=UPI00273DB665|nr:hypothetical protein [Roseibium sp. MMSF_3412]
MTDMSAVSRLRSDSQALKLLVQKLVVHVRIHMAPIIVIAALVFVAVALVQKLQPPEYPAQALLRVGDTAVDEAVLKLRPGAQNVQAVLTQARAISAPAVILGAIRDADLSNDAQLIDPGPSLKDLVSIRLLGEDGTSIAQKRIDEQKAAIETQAAELGESRARVREQHILDQIQKKLRVAPYGTSSIVEVSYTSLDPQTAARVVNAVVASYFRQQAEAGQKKLDSAIALYDKRAIDLRERLQALRKSLEEKRGERASQGLSTEALKTVASSLIADIGRTETRVRKDRAALEELSTAEELAAISMALKDLDGAYLQNLVDLAVTQEQRASFTVSGTSATVSREREALDAAIQTFVAAKRRQLTAMERNVARAKINLNHTLSEISRVEAAIAEDALLEEDIRIAGELFESTTSRADELRATAALFGDQFSLVSAAEPVLDGESVGAASILLKSIASAVLAALALFALKMIFDGTYRFSKELEEDTKFRSLPALPANPDRPASLRGALYNRLVASVLRLMDMPRSEERPSCLVICASGKVGGGLVQALGNSMADLQRGRGVTAVCKPLDRVDLRVSQPANDASTQDDVDDDATRELLFDPDDPEDFMSRARALIVNCSNTHDLVVFCFERPEDIPTALATENMCQAIVMLAEWGGTTRKSVRSVPELSLRGLPDAFAPKTRNDGKKPCSLYSMVVSAPDYICDFEKQTYEGAWAA